MRCRDAARHEAGRLEARARQHSLGLEPDDAGLFAYDQLVFAGVVPAAARGVRAGRHDPPVGTQGCRRSPGRGGQE